MLWLKRICKRILQLVPKDLCHVFVAFSGWDIIVSYRRVFHASEFTYVLYTCSVSTDFSFTSPQEH